MSMTKVGLVLENNKGNLKVQIDRTGACGSCASSESCAERKSTIVELFTADNINEGDTVILEGDSSELSKISALVYIFPVVMIVVGAILPNIIFKNSGFDLNLLTLISVLGFLLLSILFVKKLDSKYKKENLMSVKKLY